MTLERSSPFPTRPIIHEFDYKPPAESFTYCPEIHFTHLLIELMGFEEAKEDPHSNTNLQNLFSESKDCNMIFNCDGIVTLLSYLLGHNKTKKIYPRAIHALVHNPRVNLDPFCENNIFKYVVLDPTPDNTHLIRMLCAYGAPVNVTRENISDALIPFTQPEFKFKNSEERKNVLAALNELLFAPSESDFGMWASNQRTVLQQTLYMPADEKDENPFTRAVLDAIEIRCIKKIITHQIKTDSQLSLFLITLCGNKSDEKYKDALKAVSSLQNSLKVFFKPPCLESKEFAFADFKACAQKGDVKKTMVYLLHADIREQEEESMDALKSAIQQQNLYLFYQLLTALNYPELNTAFAEIFAKENDDYCLMLAILLTFSIKKISYRTLSRKAAECSQRFPRMTSVLIKGMCARTPDFINLFNIHLVIQAQKTSPENSIKKYIAEHFREFLNTFLQEGSIPDFHWRFLLQNGIDVFFKIAFSTALVPQFATAAPPELQSYAAFICAEHPQAALDALGEIDHRNQGKLSLYNLRLRALCCGFLAKTDPPELALRRLVAKIILLVECEIGIQFVHEKEYEAVLNQIKLKIPEAKLINSDQAQTETLQFLITTMLTCTAQSNKNMPQAHKKYLFLIIKELLEVIKSPTINDLCALASTHMGIAGAVAAVDSKLTIASLKNAITILLQCISIANNNFLYYCAHLKTACISFFSTCFAQANICYQETDEVYNSVRIALKKKLNTSLLSKCDRKVFENTLKFTSRYHTLKQQVKEKHESMAEEKKSEVISLLNKKPKKRRVKWIKIDEVTNQVTDAVIDECLDNVIKMETWLDDFFQKADRNPNPIFSQQIIDELFPDHKTLIERMLQAETEELEQHELPAVCHAADSEKWLTESKIENPFTQKKLVITCPNVVDMRTGFPTPFTETPYYSKANFSITLFNVFKYVPKTEQRAEGYRECGFALYTPDDKNSGPAFVASKWLYYQDDDDFLTGKVNELLNKRR